MALGARVVSSTKARGVTHVVWEEGSLDTLSSFSGTQQPHIVSAAWLGSAVQGRCRPPEAEHPCGQHPMEAELALRVLHRGEGEERKHETESIQRRRRGVKQSVRANRAAKRTLRALDIDVTALPHQDSTRFRFSQRQEDEYPSDVDEPAADESQTHVQEKTPIRSDSDEPVIIGLTSCDEATRLAADQWVAHLNGKSPIARAAVGDAGVTHLIVGEPRRTFKLLDALASGTWILATTWLQACLDQDRLVPETDHLYDHPDVPGAKMTSGPRLLSGHRVFLGRLGHEDMPRTKAARLVESAGGTIVTEPGSATLYLVGKAGEKRRGYVPEARESDAETPDPLRLEWLLQSLLARRLLDRAGFCIDEGAKVRALGVVMGEDPVRAAKRARPPQSAEDRESPAKCAARTPSPEASPQSDDDQQSQHSHNSTATQLAEPVLAVEPVAPTQKQQNLTASDCTSFGPPSVDESALNTPPRVAPVMPGSGRRGRQAMQERIVSLSQKSVAELPPTASIPPDLDPPARPGEQLTSQDPVLLAPTLLSPTTHPSRKTTPAKQDPSPSLRLSRRAATPKRSVSEAASALIPAVDPTEKPDTSVSLEPQNPEELADDIEEWSDDFQAASLKQNRLVTRVSRSRGSPIAERVPFVLTGASPSESPRRAGHAGTPGQVVEAFSTVPHSAVKAKEGDRSWSDPKPRLDRSPIESEFGSPGKGEWHVDDSVVDDDVVV
jgi:hypothetical protein